MTAAYLPVRAVMLGRLRRKAPFVSEQARAGLVHCLGLRPSRAAGSVSKCSAATTDVIIAAATGEERPWVASGAAGEAGAGRVLSQGLPWGSGQQSGSPRRRQ